MEEDIKCLISDFCMSDFEKYARLKFNHLFKANKLTIIEVEKKPVYIFIQRSAD
jgi:hypothetical protein